MSESIPHKYLKEGIETILRNIGALLDSADLLYSEKRYLHSAVFYDLAVEEMAKAQLLIDHKEKGEDLPITKWNKLSHGRGAHKKKLREYISRIPFDPSERAKIPDEISQDQIIELIADFHVRLKERVLYVNWYESSNTWQWAPEIWGEKEQMMISAPLRNVRKRYEKYMRTQAST